MATSSNMAPGRPRRQQQAYRRANTSLNLSTTSEFDHSYGDPLAVPNGMGTIVDSSPSKTKTSVKDFLLKRTMSSKDQLNNYVPASTIEAFNSFSSGTGGQSVSGLGQSVHSLGPSVASLDQSTSSLGTPGQNLSSLGTTSQIASSNVPSVPSASIVEAASSSVTDWSPASTGDNDSVINDLTISAPRQQPKYSYLVGKSGGGGSDSWRTATLPSLGTTGQSASTSGQGPQTPTVTKRRSHLYGAESGDTFASIINNSNTFAGAGTSAVGTNASGHLSYEDRINTALGRKLVGPAASKPSMINQYSVGNNNVQKSKSYSNFDSVRRDYNFQVSQRERPPSQLNHFLLLDSPFITCLYILEGI